MSSPRGLPPEEWDRLNEAVGRTCTRIETCGMTKCGEAFVTPAPDGVHCVTWGVVFGLDGGPDVALTWTEDGARGDPFSVAVVTRASLASTGYSEFQDVTHVPPWDARVGQAIRRFTCFAYRSDYGGPVVWGIELQFGSGDLLVAALRHDSPFAARGRGASADEIVVAYTPDAITRIRAARG